MARRFNGYGSWLKPKAINLEYSSDFKPEVLNCKKKYKSLLPETSLHFKLSSPSTIWQWQRKSDLEYLDRLGRLRGYPKIMAKDKYKAIIEHTTSPIKAHNGDDNELKQLKQENNILRIENEFLKN